MITIIAAITSDNGLGRRGDLLYHISADLRRFKSLTMGHPIIMGRNTFESFPNGALPGRRNIVISTRPGYTAPGIEVYPSLRDAIAATDGADCYIIGGGRVYREAMPLADSLEITHIDAPSPTDTDTYFPPIDPQEWECTHCDVPSTDPKTGTDYTFATYRRR